MSDRVRVDLEGGIANVRLNRPEALNGLDMALIDGLIDAANELAKTPGLRAVVLAGEGRSFCSGLDFPSFMGNAETAIPHLLDERVGPANRAQQVAWAWRTLPVPVIAAIHGHCYGGGLQIALGADIRLVARDSKLSVMEIKWGLIPDMAITKTLLSCVALDVAKDLVYTGRVITGEEAVNLGLCTRIAEDPIAEAQALAVSIAGRSPHAIQAAKELLDAAGGLGVAAAFELETRLQRELLGSPNQLEAVFSNFEKRAPVFAEVE